MKKKLQSFASEVLHGAGLDNREVTLHRQTRFSYSTSLGFRRRQFFIFVETAKKVNANVNAS